jgi:hypothetical protein
MSTDNKKEDTTPVMEVLEEDDEFEVRRPSLWRCHNALVIMMQSPTPWCAAPSFGHGGL